MKEKNPHRVVILIANGIPHPGLLKEINESSVQQLVWVQVILILQSKLVCVCVLKNKWPHRWRGQAFQHLPETEHAAFPFSIIQSCGPPYLPLFRCITPPSLICYSLMCFNLHLPVVAPFNLALTSLLPTLYRIVADSLSFLLPVKAAAMAINPCSSCITITCSYLFFSSLFSQSFPFNVPLSFHHSNVFLPLFYCSFNTCTSTFTAKARNICMDLHGLLNSGLLH